ncbi:alpha/beta hydrolase [Streptomyces antnestii]|uniref:alpha/beta hydrolase n=1 Tax=Streptomyces antnestii TaxID=2494256 RepID=UPI001676D9CF|nr:alpha/beta hydrolase [Streptomyces sp. San01]
MIGLPLPPPRAGRPASPELLERRRAVRRATPPPGEVRWKAEEFGGVAGIAVDPGDPPADDSAGPPIVHLHGGGYRLGGAEGWVGLAHRMARATGRRVIVPEYRLAPEHPFPAALHDAAAVWQAVADPAQGPPPVLSGDSAGGGLAVALALALRSAAAAESPAVPGPHRLVLLSPLLDLRADAPSYRLNAERDRLWGRSAAREAAEGYLQGVPPEAEPLASPLLADPAALAGLPPVLLFAGTGEALIDDATGFARRAARAQVAVEAHFLPELPHVWPLLLPDDPRSAEAMARVADFLGLS